ncbi:DUF962 domain-containing protein [Xanthomonas hyacinthi]|uniref:DUF962 domain-containing protein n=1 Tax=Xanthomonas hyacinthi TaxID=56455 RepID=A0A2S7EV30_9XANT|nr:hypothetical protein XhyaCFBP1156_12830 [Xanthomonas hyacinthi]QGY77976.1 DUF962 domain-containing protein [Xanthomonas hyacinthi]
MAVGAAIDPTHALGPARRRPVPARHGGDHVRAAAGLSGGLWAAPRCGYGCAWAGHVFFEKNHPATFRHPLYSFAGDWVMFKHMLLGRLRW